ncbi:hypothetical protein FI667_g17281, partial [Globisporangium splendens]
MPRVLRHHQRASAVKSQSRGRKSKLGASFHTQAAPAPYLGWWVRMVGRALFTRVPLSDASKVRTPTVSASKAQHIGCAEYAMTVAARLYFSSFYRLIYFFTVVSSIACVVWVRVASVVVFYERMNLRELPSSVLFISLEITVSALLVFEVLLRMMAFKRRFWTKWCNIFDVVALVMSLVSVAMYFNEEGVLGELEEVAADSILALRNAVQYIRLAIFLKNRTEKISTHDSDIDFETLSAHPDDEREAMLNAENGMDSDSDSENLQVLTKQ